MMQRERRVAGGLMLLGLLLAGCSSGAKAPPRPEKPIVAEVVLSVPGMT